MIDLFGNEVPEPRDPPKPEEPAKEFPLSDLLRDAEGIGKPMPMAVALAECNAWHSDLVDLVWSAKQLPKGRFLIQLVPTRENMWPTPMSVPDTEASHGQVSGRFRAAMRERMWMSPKAGRSGMSSKTKGGPVEKSTDLTTQVALSEGLLPTPQARDYRTGSGYRWNDRKKRTRNLNDRVAHDVGYAMFPTPRAGEGDRKMRYAQGGAPLGMAARMFPTPQADADSRSTGGKASRGNHQMNLHHVVRMFPSPTVMDSAGFCGKPDVGRRGPNSGRTLTGKVLEGEGLGPHARMLPTATANDATGSAYANQPGGKGRKALKLTGAARLYPNPTNSMVTEQDMEQARFAGNSGKRPKYADASMWPTPRGCDAEGGPTPASNDGRGWYRTNRKGVRFGVKLKDAVLTDAKLVPTPRERDWKGRTQRGGHAYVQGKALPDMPKKNGKPIGGQLNPAWVEKLMGFEPGFTAIDFKPSPKVRKPKASEIRTKAAEVSLIGRAEGKGMEE